jgi:ABC-type lipoprotein release transport system permease subunit
VDHLRELGATPQALGAFLGLLAVAAGSYSLVNTVRRRRRDLAVLRVIGFARGQVRAALRWQALTIAVVGLAVGLPLGVAAAQQLWSQVAEGLGVVDSPADPWFAIGWTVPITLAIAIVIAVGPGLTATRAHPADILHAE